MNRYIFFETDKSRNKEKEEKQETNKKKKDQKFSSIQNIRSAVSCSKSLGKK
jgi:hypothetical protein